MPAAWLREDTESNESAPELPPVLRQLEWSLYNVDDAAFRLHYDMQYCVLEEIQFGPRRAHEMLQDYEYRCNTLAPGQEPQAWSLDSFLWTTVLDH